MNLSGCHPPPPFLLAYACHLLNVTASPTLGGITPFRPSLGKYLISASFFIPPFGSLFITRLIRVSLTPVFLHIPMKSMDIGLALLKINGISSLGRFSQMILRRFSSSPVSAVPPELPPIRSSLCNMGRDKRLTSHPTLLFMMLPCLMKTLASCPPSTLMTSWGDSSSFLLKTMGSANEPASLNMSPILKIPKLPEKISCAYA